MDFYGYVNTVQLDALSVTRQMAMLARMDKLIDARSQFIIATHSPIILAYPGAAIYQMTARKNNDTSIKLSIHSLSLV